MKINGLLELRTTMRGLNKLKLKPCYIWLVIALGSIFKRLYELIRGQVFFTNSQKHLLQAFWH